MIEHLSVRQSVGRREGSEGERRQSVGRREGSEGERRQ